MLFYEEGSQSFFRRGATPITLGKCKKLRIYPRQPDPDNAGGGKLKKERGLLHKEPLFFGNVY
jgi:hypothetical protein